MGRTLALAVAIVCVWCVGAGSTAMAKNLNTLGPAPGPCQPGQTTPCTFNSRCAPVSFSPHIVHVGDEIESSAGPAKDACGPGGVQAISWSWGGGPFITPFKGPCRNTPLTQPSSCTFKADAPTETTSPSGKTVPGFAIGCINGNSGFGGWLSCDYYAVIGPHQRAISGRVLTKHGKPVNGATVDISGPTSGTVTTTPSGDYYADNLDPGHYRVTVAGPHKKVTSCSGAAHGSSCDLDLTHADGQASFSEPPDRIEWHFTPSKLAADGVANYTGTIDVIDGAGQPAVGTQLTVSPPPDVIPRSLVCSDQQVVWPWKFFSDGSPDGVPTLPLTADGNGQIPLTIWAGTVPGHMFTQAEETADSSVSSQLTFPFNEAGGGGFPLVDQFPTTFYNAMQTTQHQAGNQVFVHLNPLNTPEGEEQDILLQWLIAFGRTFFPSADFGPVNYGGHAGILFYPHGSTTPTAGPTAVLDVPDAVAVANEAGAGQPIPPANNNARTLAGWAMHVGGSTPTNLTQTLGPLKPWTGQEYAYFGFPYPRSALDAPGQVKFYNSCAAPDGTPQITQTSSPVTLVFQAADGTTFGLDAHGQPIGTGTGIVVRGRDQTTYVTPAGRYSTMGVTGTGNGTAHIELFGVVGAPLTSYARQVSNYVFRARTGVTGTLPVNFFGPAGAMSYGGRTVTAQMGLPITLSGLPKKLHHGKRKLKLVATSLGTPLPGALVILSYRSHQLRATTDGHGRASFKVTLPRGKVTITVSYPGAAGPGHSLHVT